MIQSENFTFKILTANFPIFRCIAFIAIYRTFKTFLTFLTKQYEARFGEIKLSTLSCRHSQGHLIQVNKIFNKIDDVDLDPIIQQNQIGL